MTLKRKASETDMEKIKEKGNEADVLNRALFGRIQNATRIAIDKTRKALQEAAMRRVLITDENNGNSSSSYPSSLASARVSPNAVSWTVKREPLFGSRSASSNGSFQSVHSDYSGSGSYSSSSSSSSALSVNVGNKRRRCAIAVPEVEAPKWSSVQIVSDDEDDCISVGPGSVPSSSLDEDLGAGLSSDSVDSYEDDSEDEEIPLAIQIQQLRDQLQEKRWSDNHEFWHSTSGTVKVPESCLKICKIWFRLLDERRGSSSSSSSTSSSAVSSNPVAIVPQVEEEEEDPTSQDFLTRLDNGESQIMKCTADDVNENVRLGLSESNYMLISVGAQSLGLLPEGVGIFLDGLSGVAEENLRLDLSIFNNPDRSLPIRIVGQRHSPIYCLQVACEPPGVKSIELMMRNELWTEILPPWDGERTVFPDITNMQHSAALTFRHCVVQTPGVQQIHDYVRPSTLARPKQLVFASMQFPAQIYNLDDEVIHVEDGQTAATFNVPNSTCACYEGTNFDFSDSSDSEIERPLHDPQRKRHRRLRLNDEDCATLTPDDLDLVRKIVDDHNDDNPVSRNFPDKGSSRDPKLDSLKRVRLFDLVRSQIYSSMKDCDYGDNHQLWKCSLMDHQKKAIRWMEEKEKNRITEEWLQPLVVNKRIGCNMVGSEGPYAMIALGKKKAKSACRNIVFGSDVAVLPGIFPRGGILADDMGMGKTVTTLAVILRDLEDVAKPTMTLSYLNGVVGASSSSSSPSNYASRDNKEPGSTPSSATADDHTQSDKWRPGMRDAMNWMLGGTLVVCPLAALNSWVQCIQENTNLVEGEHYLVYHGTNRFKLFNQVQLSNRVIVLTTYETITGDWKRLITNNPRCNTKPVRFHLEQWGASRGGRNNKCCWQKNAPIIGQKTAVSIFLTKWRRVVLDEAHQIRNKASLISQAVCRLPSLRRWCLTGTPLQNRTGDFAAYLRFLRVPNFDTPEEFKLVEKDKLGFSILVRWLSLRRTKDQKVKFSPQSSISPTRDSSSHEGSTVGALDTVGVATDEIISLPPKHMCVVKVKATDEEYRYYKLLDSLMKNDLTEDSMIAGTVQQSFAKITNWMMLLRQMANAGSLMRPEIWKMLLEVAKMARSGSVKDVQTANGILQLLGASKIRQLINRISKRPDESEEEQTDGENPESRRRPSVRLEVEDEMCSICWEGDPDAITPCGHRFHKSCLTTWLSQDRVCPFCREVVQQKHVMAISEFLNAASQARRPSLAVEEPELADELPACATGFSSKFDFVSSAIAHQTRTPHEDGKPVKVIVFSAFVRTLHGLEEFLTQKGLDTMFYIGCMSNKKRGETLKNFTESPKPCVLLASLKSMGVAITLTCANIVYILDPWWNPYAEDQACDRCHRIGQTRNVLVYRVIMKNTVEEFVIDRHKSKRDLLSNAYTATNINANRMAEMRAVLLKQTAESEAREQQHRASLGSASETIDKSIAAVFLPNGAVREDWCNKYVDEIELYWNTLKRREDQRNGANYN